MKSKVFISFFVLFFFCTAQAQTQNDLKRLRTQISNEEKELKKLVDNRASTVKAIALIQKKQANERRAINIINDQIKKNTDKIKKLQTEESELKKKQAQYIRDARTGAMFLVDNSNSIVAKTVFSGANSAETAKMVELVNGLNNNLNTKIRRYAGTAMELGALQKDIAQQNTELANDKAESEALYKSYANSGNELNKKLTLVKNDEAAQKEYISLLKLEQDRIDRALRQSKKVKEDTGSDFFKLKGALPFPVQGKVIETYGEYEHAGSGVKIMHKGIKIRPAAVGSVTSVSDGTVVYVDNINGMQNLIIIQHDKNYYTVYANIDEFFVNVMEKVKKGSEIGRINIDFKGDSSYLYFEIRNHDRAIDPMTWLKK